MKLDKNTLIGYVLLGVLLIAYFWYSSNQAEAYRKYEQHIADSTAKAKAALQPKIDSTTARLNAATQDSINKATAAGNLAIAATQTAQLATVENELIKVTFTNKGGRIQSVELKNYKSYNGKNVVLGSENDKLGYELNNGKGGTIFTQDVAFVPTITNNADGSKTIDYALQDSAQKYVVHHYVLKPNSYMIDWDIQLPQSTSALKNNQLNLLWYTTSYQQESSATYERSRMTNICYYENDKFDYHASDVDQKLEKPTNWLSFVQQFFNTTLVAKNNFSSGNVNFKRELADTTKRLANINANFEMKLNAGTTSIPLQMYFGPNDYNVLKTQTPPDMQRIIDLGRGFSAFVRPLNKYIIMPIFDLITKFVSSYGWAIFLLTIFIRIITAPLMYGSYVSGAKMKILRPEIEALKKKYGSDQQGFAMAQMKFNKEAGVNMFGGCLPMLLQIPIFFALFSFFNSNIALRGQPFLWSKDLSVYDAIVTWNTSILGMNHISLFTITAVLTSFAISLYNMNAAATVDNPAMKYMPYIFPFLMFFFFNNLPSALTWYYTVSNSITLILQIVIQKFIINHDKLVADIEQRRKNPKQQTKSKWQERYEQMVEAQKKVQELKAKNDASKNKF